MAIADLNGDGHLDMVTANQGNSAAGDLGHGTLAVLLGDGHGSFGPRTFFGLNGVEIPQSVAISDLNEDGHPDLVTVGFNNNHTPSTREVAVLFGDGTGGFGPAVNTVFAAGVSNSSFVAVGDVNLDGHPDVVTARQSVSVFLGDGTGALRSETEFAVTGAPLYMAVGDLNGDTRPDIVTGNAGSDVSVLFNTTLIKTSLTAFPLFSVSPPVSTGFPPVITVPGLSVGYKARLTRTVTGAPISGQTITFTAGTRTVCSATTNAEGLARCGERNLLPAVLNRGYTATYAGTSLYAPSTALGTLN